jgi:hypothetical protein
MKKNTRKGAERKKMLEKESGKIKNISRNFDERNATYDYVSKEKQI